MKPRQLAWLLFAGMVVIGGLALLTVLFVMNQHEPRAAEQWSAAAPSLLSIVLTAALLAFVWIFLLTARWSRLLKHVTAAARNLSRGRLQASTEISGADEFALLARFLNELRDRLLVQEQTIVQQRQSLEHLLDRIHEGVIVADTAGRIVTVNRAAESLLDLPPDQRSGFIGAAVERWISDHDLQRLLLRPDRDRAAPVADDEDSVDQTRVQVESGATPRHLLARAADVSLANTDGARGRLLVLTDVTEFERTLQIKSDFVTNASHELRTPLSTIRTAIETLMELDPAKEPDGARNFLRIIDRQSARLTAMVADLLDLARLESPLAKFEPRELSAREVLADLEDRFRERAQSKNLRLESVLEDAGRTRFPANPQLLALILDNLVDNAVKFTELGKRVLVRFHGEPESVTFTVADEGCGIPPGEQERVFERFYQVERARSGFERGTGLGLAIVRHAVAALDGNVRLSSELGKGTTVVVTIPAPLRATPAIRSADLPAA